MTIRTTHKHTIHSLEKDLLNGKVKIVRKASWEAPVLQEAFKRNIEANKKMLGVIASITPERISFLEGILNSIGGAGDYATLVVVKRKGNKPMFAYDSATINQGSTKEDVMLWNKM